VVCHLATAMRWICFTALLQLQACLCSDTNLYGIIRDRNDPLACHGAPSGCTQLVSVDAVSGKISKIGPGEEKSCV